MEWQLWAILVFDPTDAPHRRRMNITLDTNCIVALEENRPDARYLRRIVQSATEQQLRLRVAGISASERQPDGKYSESFFDFQAKIAGVGLEDVEILRPPLIWGVTFWDESFYGTEQVDEEAKRIHEILFPTSPFEYEDYCRHFGLDPAAPDITRRWLNRVIDTWALWSHMHNGGERWTPSFGQVFVTAKVESGVMIQATLG